MFKNLLKDYTSLHNALAISAHNFFGTFGKSTVTIFSAVLLYQIGFPMWEILLFFAVQFGVMGLFSPLSPVLVSRWGLTLAIFVSYLFRV